jgi:hypothetical protein
MNDNSKYILIKPEKAAHITLFDYTQRVLTDNSDIINIKEECIIAKHLISDYLPILERFRDKARAIDNPDSKTVSILLTLNEGLRRALLDVSKIIKTAAEIEALKSNRFDTIQLLAAVENIPRLLTDILLDELTSLLDKVNESVDNNTNSVFINKTPELREAACAEIVERIIIRMTDKIKYITVAYNRDSLGPNEIDPDLCVVEQQSPAELIKQQVESMERTIS